MKTRNYLPIAWFILGFGTFVFTRMSKLVPTIPVAILIAPVFILRFNRTRPVRRGNLLTLLGFMVSINIGLWWLYESNTVLNGVKILLLVILYSLPFLVDRPVHEKFKKRGVSSGLTTLTFPIISTAIHFLASQEGFFEGAVQTGKFVYGPVVLQQLLSLFGISGFIFVSSWFASIVNYAWENQFDWSRSKKAVMVFASIALAISLFGVIKTSRSSEQDTVRIAAILLQPDEGNAASLAEIFEHNLVTPFAATVSRIRDLTSTAASNGARIVSFQEFAMFVHEDDVERLREEYQAIAKANNVYLSISYAYFAQEGKGENKHLLIDNDGEILLDYSKRYLFGIGDIGETGVFSKGPEIVQSTETPFGRIALSLCRDMEMPDYMRQAGKADVDIMLSPAWETPKGLIVHSVYMRTIEYGFSLVRPTQDGITVAVDYNGKILNQMDSAETKDSIMYADVPTQGVNTLYTRIGDVLGWVCVVGLLGVIPLGIILRKKQKKDVA